MLLAELRYAKWITYLAYSFSVAQGIGYSKEQEKCIDELGCFVRLGPFYNARYRPIAILPSDRDVIATKFRLYTNDHPLLAQELRNNNNTDFSETNLNVTFETKVIIHGFREKELEWMIDLKDAFLSEGDVNVVTVDWGQGAAIPYTQAATNTRVVGAELALLLSRLKDRLGLDFNRTHLVGFSLGAHVAGYAGERLDKVRRITALDPAGPLFENLPEEVRLDPSDATFVDAIHTDGRSIYKLSFGSSTAMGHVDFFPNRGQKQPGCPENIFDTVLYASVGALVKGMDKAGVEITCRHSRAKELFMDSIRNKHCRPKGFPCQDWETFQSGQCYTCGVNGNLCGVMGINAENYKPADLNKRGIKLYLKTRSSKPYCLFHYNVRLRITNYSLEDNQTSSRIPSEEKKSWFRIPVIWKNLERYGTPSLSLKGSKRSSAHAKLSQSDAIFKSGQVYNFLFVSEEDLGDLQSLLLTWTPASKVYSFFKFRANREGLPIEEVKVTFMSYKQNEWIFCGKNQTVDINQPVYLFSSTTC